MTYRFTADGHKVSLLGYGAMRLPTVDGKHANGWASGASSADIDQELVNRQVKMLTYLIRESVISDQISTISSGIISRSLFMSLLVSLVLIGLFAMMFIQMKISDF